MGNMSDRLEPRYILAFAAEREAEMRESVCESVDV